MSVLRVKKVVERTRLARSTIYKKVDEGDFPPPRQLTSRAVGWLEEEVEEWLASRPVADVAYPGRELKEETETEG